ncbi:MAG: helix-turn-helix transcriptional regulator [Steroidobacteraceae bacterium]
MAIPPELPRTTLAIPAEARDRTTPVVLSETASASRPVPPKSGASTRQHAGRPFDPTASLQLLRIEDVCRLLRISKPTFWRLRRRADFPEPTAITDRVIGWPQREIEAWLRQRRRPVR